MNVEYKNINMEQDTVSPTEGSKVRYKVCVCVRKRDRQADRKMPVLIPIYPDIKCNIYAS